MIIVWQNGGGSKAGWQFFAPAALYSGLGGFFGPSAVINLTSNWDGAISLTSKWCGAIDLTSKWESS